MPLSPERTSPFEGLAVLVLGDVMLDHYVYGRTERISPEAPVPVLEWQREEWRLGGAANVALNLKALGARPLLVGLTGADEHARQLGEMLSREGIEPHFLVQDARRPTTVKTRFYSRHQQLLRLDRESEEAHAPEMHRALWGQLEKALGECSPWAVVLQDYDKGTLSPRLAQEAVALFGRHGVPVAVDPKRRHFFDYRGVELFKPNLKEICQALGRTVRPEPADLRAADEELRRRLGHRKTVITLGEHGLYWSDETGRAELVPAIRLSVVDVCGAGDSVVSVLSAALGAKLPFAEAIRLANLAGGVACSRPGVVPVGWRDLVP